MTADSVPGSLAAACAEVRLAGPRDAVAGTQPSFVAAPASVAEASGLMRAAASLGLAVVPTGRGTKLTWGTRPARCDLVIETRLLDQVLEHAAGDLVARVQAGVGLDQLAEVLAASGQRLAVDPHMLGGTRAGTRSESKAGSSARARADAGARSGAGAGTIGGLLATGTAGPLRLRYGTPRDLAIGITVVRADGAVARSGGKVVKNVAGYDLGKLFAGSYGTLGLIVEAAFRLHPLPAATAFVTLDCTDGPAARSAMAVAADSPLAPSAAEIDRPARDAPIRAGILLEGDVDGVAERAERMRTLLGDGAVVASRQPPWWGRGAAAADGTVIKIGYWAGELAAVLAAIDTAAAAADLDPAVSGSAEAGVIYAAVSQGADPVAVAGFLTGLRAAFADGLAGLTNPAGLAHPDGHAGLPSRGSAVILRCPAQVGAVADVWGPVPSLPLMRAVKDQFDPEHRMAPGRFAGGI